MAILTVSKVHMAASRDSSDDGMDEIITLPDNTVRLTGEAVVARCKCGVCQVCCLSGPRQRMAAARCRFRSQLLGAP